MGRRSIVSMMPAMPHIELFSSENRKGDARRPPETPQTFCKKSSPGLHSTLAYFVYHFKTLRTGQDQQRARDLAVVVMGYFLMAVPLYL